MPQSQSGADKRAREQRNTLIALGWVAAAAVAFILVLALINGGGSKDSNSDKGQDPNSYRPTAIQLCENAVRDQLKAPSTADFSVSTASLSSNKWIVTGSVDAENSFGATLRKDFQCTVFGGSARVDFLG